jgi:hypothetical protein
VKFGKVYGASKKPPVGIGPTLLVFLDEAFTWAFGHYDPKAKKYVTHPPYEGCAVLYWTPLPPHSIFFLTRLASV